MPKKGTKPDPNLGGVTTSPREKARNTRKGKDRSTVPASKSGKPSKGGKGLHDPVNLPPLKYDRGPIHLPIETYEFRVRTRAAEASTLLNEIESLTWDDSSALMTGTLTMREPDWAKKAQIVDGSRITCDYRVENRGGWQPLWTMRVYQPTKQFDSNQRSFQMTNDLQRLADSTDTFHFVKSKRRKKGWRGDEVIREICTKYGIPIGSLPKLTARIKSWVLIDQRPLDILHAVLLREKHESGRKYAVSLDASGRLHVRPYRRPRQLYRLGPLLIAATLSIARQPRFATALTVRADGPDRQTKDKKGHKKTTHKKIAVSVQTPGGVKQYGYIHRNVYSPDADTRGEARKEGQMFLVAVGRANRQFQVTMPGMPDLRRLDAIRFVLPEEGLKQIVYVIEGRHSVSGGDYTTDAIFTFDDPFVDRKADRILNKLSDTAIARSRQATPTTKKKPKKNKNRQTKKSAATKPDPSLAGKTTPAGPKPKKTGSP